VQQLGYSNLGAATWVQQLGYSNLATATWVQQLGYSNLGAATWVQQLGCSNLATATWVQQLGYSETSSNRPENICSPVGKPLNWKTRFTHFSARYLRMAKRKKSGNARKSVAKKKTTSRQSGALKRANDVEPRRESGFRMTSEAVDAALFSNEHTHLLEEYFGEEQHQELRELAAQAQSRNTRGGPRVLILPGIMGSTLGIPGTFFDNTIWIDPIDILWGNLSKISLQGGDARVKPLGVILFSYLQLKLRLKIAGFNADFHPFDWRQSLDKIGRQLADRIREETAVEPGSGRTRSRGRNLYLVAHSMGGLVARAALSQLSDAPDAVRRLVMLGTPNHGSFAPVQALRAEYPTVKNVAAFDLVHGVEELTETVFNTFPGLYQMLPFPEKFSAVDLYEVPSWPATKPRPQKAILNAVQAVQRSLAPGNDRMALIAGVDQETITNLRVEEGEFEYLTSRAGDGTVPLEFAKLDNVPTWYVKEGHGSLPNNRAVIRATIDLLQTGTTTVLPTEWSPERREIEQKWKAPPEPFDGRTGEDISAREARHLLSDLAAPMKPSSGETPTARTEAGTSELSSEPIVIGRKRQHRIDLFMAHGDVTQVDTRAVVLGLFNDVAPSGAALAFDRQLDGVITEFTERRMFSGNMGEIFVMPAARRRVQTELVVFAGLGSFDSLDGDVLRTVAENVARTLISTGVNEFATVLLGGNSIAGLRDALANMVGGFLAGIKDADTSRRMRSITFCENDPVRFELLRREMLHLSTTPLMDGVEITVESLSLPPAPAPPVSRRGESHDREPCYLFVHRQTATFADPEAPEASNQIEEILTLQSSVLTPTGKATVVTDSRLVDRSKLRSQLEKIEMNSFDNDSIKGFGTDLTDLVLPDSIKTVLKTVKDNPLVVIHDAEASRIPWETMCIDGWFPASSQGLSRKYAAENLSVATWLENRRLAKNLSILLVINPTGDLPGAQSEGKAVRKLMEADRSIDATIIERSDATWSTLRAELQSGKYDVLHYAGHAFFDPVDRFRSGLICHEGRVLSGADLAGIGGLPALAFINGCEAARVRSRKDRSGGQATQERVEKTVSLAEAFLRGGIANYVGTYWPVGDAAAERFSESFYKPILDGQPIAAALIAARKVVEAMGSVDWANYIHYGSPNFKLKRK
jgi:CHAT domain-containing protein/pimeloyl-ACP methyl ester carboxylesterase